ncbi:GNAT family N-acetyltransferase [Streptomyces sp. NPDC057909]|uniref:GNAT family N-acetyltransferase n=1 Tax=Streptomyces sp. NPDC057909 TaxID=3346277 RepID=UPI0036E2AE0E
MTSDGEKNVALHNTAPKIVVRPRTTSDVTQSASALESVHASDGYPVEGVEHPIEWLEPAGLLGAWVAVTGEQVVGHVAVTRSAGEEAVSLWAERSGATWNSIGVLARLFVVSTARGNSLGECLILAAEEYARSAGLRLVLDVMAKDSAAIRLYERLGWSEIGQITHSFGNGGRMDALAYVSPGR